MGTFQNKLRKKYEPFSTTRLRELLATNGAVPKARRPMIELIIDEKERKGRAEREAIRRQFALEMRDIAKAADERALEANVIASAANKRTTYGIAIAALALLFSIIAFFR